MREKQMHTKETGGCQKDARTDSAVRDAVSCCSRGAVRGRTHNERVLPRRRKPPALLASSPSTSSTDVLFFPLLDVQYQRQVLQGRDLGHALSLGRSTCAKNAVVLPDERST